MRELIKQFVKICAETLPISEPIYEFGSLQVPGQEGFADLRPLFPGKKYVGCDMREGPGVDKILNLHSIDIPSNSVGTVLILDTLEHVEFPHKALEEAYRILQPNGIVITSSVMNFPIHDYPYDYWRFTPQAFKSLLKPFSRVFVGFAGEEKFPHTVVGVGFKDSTVPLERPLKIARMMHIKNEEDWITKTLTEISEITDAHGASDELNFLICYLEKYIVRNITKAFRKLLRECNILKKVPPESKLARKWLTGLLGLEIKPSAHNPFYEKGMITSARNIPKKEPQYYFANARPELVQLIPASVKQILDAGCGYGMTGELIKKKIPECKVIGIEIDQEVAQIAAQRLDRVIVGDVEHLEVSNRFGYFDCIIFADVLEHLVNPWSVLKRYGTLLSDKGIIIASIPNVRNLTVINNLVNGKWSYQERGILDETHLRFFTRFEIEKMFTNCGFEISKLLPVSDPSFGKKNQNNLGQLNIEFDKFHIKNISRSELDELTAIQFLVVAVKNSKFNTKMEL